MRQTAIAFCFLLAFNWASAAIIYVAHDATGANDGSSWADAFTDLQDAIDAADPEDVDGIDEIWVKSGTYFPTKNLEGTPAGDNGTPIPFDDVTQSELTFLISKSVEIYGGFIGTETLRTARDPEANVTLLNGDFDPGLTSDNANTVVFMFSPDASVLGDIVFDGFTVSGGTDRGSYGGGGIALSNVEPITLNNLKVTDCTTQGNGGGIYINSPGVVTMSNVTIENCQAARDGGGLYVNGADIQTSELEVDGLKLLNNSAGDDGGAAFFRIVTSVVLTNVLVVGNTADDNGGGIGSRGSNGTIDENILLTHATFYGNTAPNGVGGALYTEVSAGVQIYNSIIAGNSDISGSSTASSQISRVSNSLNQIGFSLIQNSGGSGAGWTLNALDDAGNNIDTDPLFEDPDGTDDILGNEDDNFALQPLSPAINVGTSSVPNLTSYPSFDLVDQSRIQFTIPDLGSLESVFATNFPVEWLSFDGKLEDSDLGLVGRLTWETASELNSSHFVVERQVQSSSNQGTFWEAVGQVQAAGYSQEVQQYHFADNQLAGLPTGAKLYYRLRQIDLDGTQSFSEVLSMNMTANRQAGLKVAVSPNPAKDFATLTVAFQELPSSYGVRIVDMQGRPVWQTQAQGTEVSLPVSTLSPGIYVVEVSNQQLVQQKLIQVGF